MSLARQEVQEAEGLRRVSLLFVLSRVILMQCSQGRRPIGQRVRLGVRVRGTVVHAIIKASTKVKGQGVL